MTTCQSTLRSSVAITTVATMRIVNLVVTARRALRLGTHNRGRFRLPSGRCGSRYTVVMPVMAKTLVGVDELGSEIDETHPNHFC